MCAGFIKKDLQLFWSKINILHYDFGWMCSIGGEKFEFGAQRNELCDSWFAIIEINYPEKREKGNF